MRGPSVRSLVLCTNVPSCVSWRMRVTVGDGSIGRKATAAANTSRTIARTCQRRLDAKTGAGSALWRELGRVGIKHLEGLVSGASAHGFPIGAGRPCAAERRLEALDVDPFGDESGFRLADPFADSTDVVGYAGPAA